MYWSHTIFMASTSLFYFDQFTWARKYYQTFPCCYGLIFYILILYLYFFWCIITLLRHQFRVMLVLSFSDKSIKANDADIGTFGLLCIIWRCWNLTIIYFEKLYNEKLRQTATCSASFGCVWSLGAWLPYGSPTNGPWACLEVLAGEQLLVYQRCSSAGIHPLAPSAGLREGHTWNGGRKGTPA